MKIAIVGNNPDKLKKHLTTIERYRSSISDKPNIVVAVGGDGTYLAAERVYPGVPKLLVRDESICKMCDCDNLEEGLKLLLNGKFRVKEFKKLKATLGKKVLEAVSDIVVRNVDPTHAVRFRVWVNGRRMEEEFIGDGVVVSTVVGSGGYFFSIAKKTFEQGIGLAFNNTTKGHAALVFDENVRIELEVTRGVAHLAGDNNPTLCVMNEGDKVLISQSEHVARIVQVT